MTKCSYSNVTSVSSKRCSVMSIVLTNQGEFITDVTKVLFCGEPNGGISQLQYVDLHQYNKEGYVHFSNTLIVHVVH